MSYIDKETVINEIHRWIGYIDEDLITRINIGISRIPDADVEPIRHGEWVRKEDEYVYWHECSECGDYPPYDHDVRVFSRYCPNCGAKMDKGEADT